MNWQVTGYTACLFLLSYITHDHHHTCHFFRVHLIYCCEISQVNLNYVIDKHILKNNEAEHTVCFVCGIFSRIRFIIFFAIFLHISYFLLLIFISLKFFIALTECPFPWLATQVSVIQWTPPTFTVYLYQHFPTNHPPTSLVCTHIKGFSMITHRHHYNKDSSQHGNLGYNKSNYTLQKSWPLFLEWKCSGRCDYKLGNLIEKYIFLRKRMVL